MRHGGWARQRKLSSQQKMATHPKSGPQSGVDWKQCASAARRASSAHDPELKSIGTTMVTRSMIDTTTGCGPNFQQGRYTRRLRPFSGW